MQADSGKIGSMDGSPNGGRSSSSSSSSAAAAGGGGGGGGGQDFFGQVPEVHWAVPELPSPPTASGLHWQRDPRYGGGATDASAVFVPDISSPENPFRCFAAAGAGDHTMKRRRRC